MWPLPLLSLDVKPSVEEYVDKLLAVFFPTTFIHLPHNSFPPVGIFLSIATEGDVIADYVLSLLQLRNIYTW